MSTALHQTVLCALALALGSAGCGQSAHDAQAAPVQRQESMEAVAQARQAMADSGLSEAAIDAASARIERLLVRRAKPGANQAGAGEPELTAMLGALYARKAAFHADRAQQAGIYLSTAFRYLDRAVARYPDNFTARIYRGMTSAKVPEFFNKSNVAREDLQFVVRQPEFARLAPDMRARVRAALDDVVRRSAHDAGQS